MLSHVDEMVTVTEEAILHAIFFMWERTKIVVEPTDALAAAALFEGPVNVEPGARIGVSVSGGNVDLKRATELLA